MPERSYCNSQRGLRSRDTATARRFSAMIA